MTGEVVTLAAEVVPFASSAAAAYGGAVLARVREDAADSTVELGRRLLQRIFGTRSEHEPIPEPVADVVADPADEDALAALRLAVRKALATDPGLQDEINDILSQAQVTISENVSNTISGGKQFGPVLMGRDFSNVTLDSSRMPSPGRPEEQDVG